MEREVSRMQGELSVADHPGPEQLQALVDATEAATTAHYRRLRDYTVLVTTALRHADAMSRLDLALQLG
ncbi:MAG TPA: hypothetical protein VF112_09950 [Candidatus Dormibacteraeota bacterium]